MISFIADMSTTRVGVVVVLGDPRMQYHMVSLVSHGCEVDIIGYQGTPMPDSICEMVGVVHIRPVTACMSKLPKILAYVCGRVMKT